MSIKINNISKAYGNQEALRNVSLNINKGDVIGLLGPNGAGKSTLIRIITCYLAQDSGDIRVCDLDGRKNPLEVKSKIGYLPENNPLYTDMYIKEYLEFIGNIYEIDNISDKIKEVMKKTGLIKEKGKKIKNLSKGYCQRVGLAASLIHDPEILILDEPTTGLDPNQLIEIRELIKQLGKEKTILLSTHIMQEVDKMCNRIIILKNGEIVDDKKITDLKNQEIDLERHFRQLTS